MNNIIIRILVMITIMIIIIEKDLTSSCQKNTRLIFENVTKQSHVSNFIADFLPISKQL